MTGIEKFGPGREFPPTPRLKACYLGASARIEQSTVRVPENYLHAVPGVRDALMQTHAENLEPSLRRALFLQSTTLRNDWMLKSRAVVAILPPDELRALIDSAYRAGVHDALEA